MRKNRLELRACANSLLEEAMVGGRIPLCLWFTQVSGVCDQLETTESVWAEFFCCILSHGRRLP